MGVSILNAESNTASPTTNRSFYGKRKVLLQSLSRIGSAEARIARAAST